MRPLAPLQLLVVCTANMCRSPMAEALARHQLTERQQVFRVVSAGTLAMPGSPATDEAVETMSKRGLDITQHRSREVTAELSAWANLTIVMERQHIVDLVTRCRAPLAATFTLPELAAMATAADPRHPDEDIADWLVRIAADRQPESAFGGAGGAPEIADPIGRPLRAYRDTANQLDHLLQEVFDAMYAPPVDDEPTAAPESETAPD